MSCLTIGWNLKWCILESENSVTLLYCFLLLLFFVFCFCVCVWVGGGGEGRNLPNGSWPMLYSWRTPQTTWRLSDFFCHIIPVQYCLRAGNQIYFLLTLEILLRDRKSVLLVFWFRRLITMSVRLTSRRPTLMDADWIWTRSRGIYNNGIPAVAKW